MGRKRTPGLYKRKDGENWIIDKAICGHRIRKSTGTSNLAEAELILARMIEEVRKNKYFGVRPKRIFKQAVIKFLTESCHDIVSSTRRAYALQLKLLAPYIGDLALESINMSTLQRFIEARRNEGVKSRTINHALQTVRRILRLAASDEWLDANGLTWLKKAPRIKLFKEKDRRSPYPITWDEQKALFKVLPSHLKNMALFAVHTGCRDQVICNLQWDWENKINGRSVFIAPKWMVKNQRNRLIVCNKVVQEVVESVRSEHPSYVFTYKGKPIKRMNNTAWRKARKKQGLEMLRVHDLRHTLGSRLRSAGVHREDRKVFLGHETDEMALHYAEPEIEHLQQLVDRVCDEEQSGTILRVVFDKFDTQQGKARICFPANSPHVADDRVGETK